MRCLMSFGVLQKVDPKTQRSATMADNVETWAIFCLGRRKMQFAGDEEEEGLLRTVECVFKI